MNVLPTRIPDIKVIEPTVYGDRRGYLFESFNQRQFANTVDGSVQFVQENHSRSCQWVLRGLHYQIRQPQGKLVRVVAGEIFDVSVDMRRHSPTFGQWVRQRLSATNRLQMWIPAGFAHGFVVLSETAEVLYKATDFYAPQYERSIRWDDPALAIAWPLPSGIKPVMSDKDKAASSFATAEVFESGMLEAEVCEA